MMREKLEALAKGLDCGDHSCRYAVDKTGMRTNGGCRCTVRQVTEWGIRMRDAILAAAEPDQSLRDAVELLRKRLHSLYECRLESDKLLVMVERYYQEEKRKWEGE